MLFYIASQRIRRRSFRIKFIDVNDLALKSRYHLTACCSVLPSFPFNHMANFHMLSQLVKF